MRKSHSRQDWSLPFEMQYRPSPLGETYVTPSVWPMRTPAGLPPERERRSQILTNESSEPEMSTLEEAASAKATALTSSEWPSTRRTRRRASMS